MFFGAPESPVFVAVLPQPVLPVSYCLTSTVCEPLTSPTEAVSGGLGAYLVNSEFPYIKPPHLTTSVKR